MTCDILKSELQIISELIYLTYQINMQVVLIIKLDTFLMGVRFELRTLCLQSRPSTTWTTPPVHFALDVLEMGSCKCMSGLALNRNPSNFGLPNSYDYRCEPPELSF
jgi:hypothetical protein